MNERTDFDYDVFISYSPADREWVEGYLLDALNTANVRVHSELNFALGAPRIVEFERAIKRSKRTILVLSPAYMAEVARQFVDVMLQSYGLESGTWPVIPLLLKSVELPPRLAFLVPLDATDAKDWADVMVRLCSTLQTALPVAAARPPCPYPGMRAFREHETTHFYGRETEVEELMQRLRRHPFIAVIGPSGSGKSSLVNAGLIPALRRSALFGEGEWLVRALRPGAQPRTELARALDTAEFQEFTPATLLAKAQNTTRLLLVVDQFEEAFTQGSAEKEAFFAAIQRFVSMRNCYAVITVRSDFFTDLLTSTLWSLIQAHRLEIAPLGEAGLRTAIVKPAEDMGVFIESALVERLVAGSAGQPGVLPFVQEVLVRLWEKLERRFLSLRAYDALVLTYSKYSGSERSGIQAAMAQLGDELINQLSPEQQRIARRVFLRLVQFGEGRADTRRQQPVSALRTASDDPTVFNLTLRYLTDNRLLTMSSDEAGEPRVDISHEAMMTSWPLLEGWIAHGKHDELTRRQVEAATGNWERLKRKGGLLDEGELTEIKTWLDSAAFAEADLSPGAVQFIEQSRYRIARILRSRRIRNLLALLLILATFGVLSTIAINYVHVRWLQSHWQTAGAPDGALMTVATAGRHTALGSYDYGLAYRDGSGAWIGWLNNGLPHSLPSTTTHDPTSTVRTVASAAIDTIAPYTMTVWVVDSGLYQMSIEGKVWEYIGDGVPLNTLGALPLATHQGTLLAVADNLGVYSRAAGEDEWHNLAETEPALNQQFYAVAFDATGAPYLSGTSGFYRGAGSYPWRWEHLAKIPEATLFALDEQQNIYVVLKSPTPKQRPRLACFDRHGDQINKPSQLPVSSLLLSLVSVVQIESIVAHPNAPYSVYIADNFGAVYSATCAGQWHKIGQQNAAITVPSSLAVQRDRFEGTSLLWASRLGLLQRRIE